MCGIQLGYNSEPLFSSPLPIPSHVSTSTWWVLNKWTRSFASNSKLGSPNSVYSTHQESLLVYRLPPVPVQIHPLNQAPFLIGDLLGL